MLKMFYPLVPFYLKISVVLANFGRTCQNGSLQYAGMFSCFSFHSSSSMGTVLFLGFYTIGWITSFKGGPNTCHFIFEINVGKRRIRHITTLSLSMSDPIRGQWGHRWKKPSLLFSKVMRDWNSLFKSVLWPNWKSYFDGFNGGVGVTEGRVGEI